MPAEDHADERGGTGSGILDEATLRALLEHIPVTVYIDRLDETGSNVYTSPQLEAELGYTVQEWVSDSELYRRFCTPRTVSGCWPNTSAGATPMRRSGRSTA